MGASVLLRGGMQARRYRGQGALPPNNSPRLYIEALYTVPFNHFSIDFYPV